MSVFYVVLGAVLGIGFCVTVTSLCKISKSSDEELERMSNCCNYTWKKEETREEVENNG